MIIVKVNEIQYIGARTKKTVYLEYQGNRFVNRSSTLLRAIQKYKDRCAQYNTLQSKQQMRDVYNSKYICTHKNVKEIFPEYFI